MNETVKSIFILGGSSLQIPAIKMAKEKGLYVFVLDYDPKAVGIRYADKFLEISTIDKDAVLKAAQEYKPDYIITSASDMPVRTVSWVCEKLGKKTDISYEGSLYATNKVAMRNRMKECGVPIPEYRIIKNIDEFIAIAETMPDKFVLKPADNSASRGVVLIDKNKKNDLEEKYNYCIQYSRNGEALVEEFLVGAEVSVEGYTVEGNHNIITITDKIVSELPYFVEIGHTEPSRLSDYEQDDIKKVAKAAMQAIGMRNGPTHTEIKVTSAGAKLIEIAARLGGDHITSHLVPLSTGVDMVNCSYATLLGETVDCKSKYNRGAAIRFICGKEGVFDSVVGVEEALSIRGVREIEIYKTDGDNVQMPRNSSDRIGHIIAVGENADEAEENAEEALSKLKIKYKEM